MVVHKHSREYREFQKSAIRNQAVVRLLAGFMMNTDTLVKHLQNSETDPHALQIGKTLLDDLAFFEEHLSWEQFDQMMAELFICRIVDAFLTYLPQVLLSAFTERPELFKGYFNLTGKKGEAEKKVNMREVLDYLLKYDNTRDVIQQLAQDQVEELGHKGLSVIIDDLNSRFGVGFDTKLLEYKSSCELVEVRNIVVHNACYVSKLFLERTKRTDLKVGDKYPLTVAHTADELQKFFTFADEFDNQLVSHLKLTPTD